MLKDSLIGQWSARNCQYERVPGGGGAVPGHALPGCGAGCMARLPYGCMYTGAYGGYMGVCT